ncbi:MAG TPA: hypothetical protein VGJ15_04960 [Pirellulales bacterium]|jgi:hypothetical protein
MSNKQELRPGFDDLMKVSPQFAISFPSVVIAGLMIGVQQAAVRGFPGTAGVLAVVTALVAHESIHIAWWHGFYSADDTDDDGGPNA